MDGAAEEVWRVVAGGPGGWVLAVIFAVSVGAWTAMLWYAVRLREETSEGFRWAEEAIRRAEQGGRAEALAACSARPTVLGRVLAEALSWPAVSRRFFERHLWPLVDREAEQLRAPLAAITACAALLPLLGLLGTVLGMVEAFDALGGVGVGGPKRLAGGIERALWTTQAGLVAAVPVLLGHGVLSARCARYTDRILRAVKQAERALVAESGEHVTSEVGRGR